MKWPNLRIQALRKNICIFVGLCIQQLYQLRTRGQQSGFQSLLSVGFEEETSVHERQPVCQMLGARPHRPVQGILRVEAVLTNIK